MLNVWVKGLESGGQRVRRSLYVSMADSRLFWSMNASMIQFTATGGLNLPASLRLCRIWRASAVREGEERMYVNMGRVVASSGWILEFPLVIIVVRIMKVVRKSPALR